MDKTNYLWSFFEAGELGWRDRVNERVSVCVRESVCVCTCEIEWVSVRVCACMWCVCMLARERDCMFVMITGVIEGSLNYV